MSTTPETTIEIEPHLRSLTSENDRAFCRRVWEQPSSVYTNRLRAIGFEDRGHVLDAGAGFGQWSIPLARLNRRVVAADVSPARTRVTAEIAGALGLEHLEVSTGDLETLPFADGTFDAVFSFSVLYLTDYRAALRNIHRMLRPDGLLYFCTNDLGWYLHTLRQPHNDVSDYSSHKTAIAAIENSIAYFAGGRRSPDKPILMPRDVVLGELPEMGYRVLNSGDEGTIGNDRVAIRPFFDARVFGAGSVYEVLCRKV